MNGMSSLSFFVYPWSIYRTGDENAAARAITVIITNVFIFRPPLNDSSLISAALESWVESIDTWSGLTLLLKLNPALLRPRSGPHHCSSAFSLSLLTVESYGRTCGQQRHRPEPLPARKGFCALNTGQILRPASTAPATKINFKRPKLRRPVKLLTFLAKPRVPTLPTIRSAYW